MARRMLLIAAAICASAGASHGALTTGDPSWAEPARIDRARAPARILPIESIEIIAVGAPRAEPDPPPRRVICASAGAADCYAASWLERLSARAAPSPMLAAAPFAMFSVCAIGYGLLRNATRRGAGVAADEGGAALRAPGRKLRPLPPG